MFNLYLEFKNELKIIRFFTYGYFLALFLLLGNVTACDLEKLPTYEEVAAKRHLVELDQKSTDRIQEQINSSNITITKLFAGAGDELWIFGELGRVLHFKDGAAESVELGEIGDFKYLTGTKETFWAATEQNVYEFTDNQWQKIDLQEKGIRSLTHIGQRLYIHFYSRISHQDSIITIEKGKVTQNRSFDSDFSVKSLEYVDAALWVSSSKSIAKVSDSLGEYDLATLTMPLVFENDIKAICTYNNLMYIVTYTAVFSLDGDELKLVAPLPTNGNDLKFGYSGNLLIECTADGYFWLAKGETLIRYNGQKFVEIKKKDFFNLGLINRNILFFKMSESHLFLADAASQIHVYFK